MRNHSSLVYVDLQGFYLLDRFIPKELCILKGIQTNYFLFKPDLEFNALNRNDKTTVYHTEDYHGLKYTSGYVDYNLIDDILKTHLSYAEIVYVRGQIKYKFLLNKFSELNITSPLLVNIEKFDNSPRWENCPKIQKSLPLCLNHMKQEGICALNNCILIKDWIYDCIPV